MKAIEISHFGGPEALQLTERPIPIPGPGEILIRVVAAGINRPDVLQRQGHYPPPPGASDLPGLEVSGIVESDGITFKKGDHVCALLSGGGYADYVSAPEGQCLPVPDELDLAHAAALPEAVFTVWNNLFVRGDLKPGETALIHGGASGIGTTAIRMAALWGATVIVTAGSPQKCRACRDLGAHHAIHYQEEDFVAAIIRLTEGKGVDVVLDMVGGPYIPRNIACLAPEGRHISIAHLQGGKAEINIRDIMQKRLTLTGSTLRPRPVAEKQRLRDGILEHIWPFVATGALKPLIFATFPLEQAPAAHAVMESGRHIGKLILLP